MSEGRQQSVRDEGPLVAVVCSVPLLGEAVRDALEFAEVRMFAGGRDTAGLLHWLRPDVVIVDSDGDAQAAAPFALEHDLPLLHVSLRDQRCRLLAHGEWENVLEGSGPTPESIRNVVAGVLFARGRR